MLLLDVLRNFVRRKKVIDQDRLFIQKNGGCEMMKTDRRYARDNVKKLDQTFKMDAEEV